MSIVALVVNVLALVVLLVVIVLRRKPKPDELADLRLAIDVQAAQIVELTKLASDQAARIKVLEAQVSAMLSPSPNSVKPHP